MSMGKASGAHANIAIVAALIFVLSTVALLPTFPQPADAATDTTPPTISVGSPKDGAIVSGTIQWNIGATDNGGIHHVSFFIDGNPYTSDPSYPYGVNLATATMSNGQHKLLAVAYDNAMNSARKEITVNVNNPDTTAPTVTILSPLTGATVSSIIDYKVRATDVNGITKVDFYVDNVFVGTDSTAEYDAATNNYVMYRISWNTASVPNGSHTLLAKGYDQANNVGTRSITVTVSNSGGSSDTTAPVLTVPSAMTVEATGPSGASVTFAVTATDNVDGPVTAVCTPASGSTFPIATTTVNCSAIDAAGNTRTGSFLVTVTFTDTTPPVAPIIFTPASGTTTSDTTQTFTGTAEASSTVKLYDGTNATPKATTTASSTGSWSATSSTLSSGTHSMTGKATDAAGNASPASAATSITITIATGDTTPPTVSITSPTSGKYVKGVITVSASASDNIGVSKVEFYVDNVLKSVDTASPYSFSLDTKTLTNTGHTLKAVAYDAANNLASYQVTINVDNVLPTVSITSPANGATVSGVITIAATATDSSGINYVYFYIDGVYKTFVSTSPYSYTYDTNRLSNGIHTIMAKAFDKASNSASYQITITTNNANPDFIPPTVSITSPANGATIKGTVTVTAIASDNYPVQKVQFLVDGVIKTTDLSSPYTYSLNTLLYTVGTHTLSAKAWDDAGKSSTATITVNITR